MLHSSSIRFCGLPILALVCGPLATACNFTEPVTTSSAALQTDRPQYVLGYGAWNAPMQVTYTNPRTDTVYVLFACGGSPLVHALIPGRHAERVDATGHPVFVENMGCPIGSWALPPAIAVAPGTTFVDTASLRVSEWQEGDSAGSVAAIVGHFRLVYDLCVAAQAAGGVTCDTLPLGDRVTNVFNVVPPRD